VRGILVLAIVLTVIAGGVTIAAGGVEEKKEEPKIGQTGGTLASEPAEASEGTVSDEAAARAQIGATVRMRRLRFKPATVTISAGEAVKWVNHDNVVHNVVATTGSGTEQAAFTSRSIAPLSTYVTAPRAGTYLYVCTIHPTVMHGRVVVNP
jgi:plastocyanin